MKEFKFKTNLRCESCLAKVGPLLDQTHQIKSWVVDLKDPNKMLVVFSDINFDPLAVKILFSSAGYQAIEVSNELPLESLQTPSAKTYFPLILILFYLLGGVTLAQYRAEFFDLKEAMNQFMGGFFIVFSFFKVLNLNGFTDVYSTYDIIAKKWKAYGYLYPFIELALGVSYWTHFAGQGLHLVTILVMGVSSMGVIQSLLEKRKIKCACLGAIFNLPMSSITLVEDLLMVGMALVMVIFN